MTELPPDMGETERAAPLARERERGGALRNADALHEALTSLPAHPYARISVTAPAGHPPDSDPAAGSGTT